MTTSTTSTIFDVTYEQLFTLDSKSLNQIQAEFIVTQIREKLEKTDFPKEWIGPYTKAIHDRLPALLNEVCNDEHFETLRFLYDTPEKFDKAAKIAGKALTMGAQVQALVGEAIKVLEVMELPE